MAFFADRLSRFPNAHVYHYAAYETSALRRLTSSHGIGEALLDQMLRENRFVDLYSVVSGGPNPCDPGSPAAARGQDRQPPPRASNRFCVAHLRAELPETSPHSSQHALA